ncbi:hypothetical protein IU411_20845 [Nocardia farcinica]|nr:hypothetical protein [Nocardia farcinica]
MAADRLDAVRQVLDRVGDTWSLLELAGLADGPLRYSDLRAAAHHDDIVGNRTGAAGNGTPT